MLTSEISDLSFRMRTSERCIVMLPGLDGTGALFDNFIRAAPACVRLEVIALPPEPLDYHELAARIAPNLRLTRNTILLAESFSGPLAILIAEQQPIASLVLCNSFVMHPCPRAFGMFPLSVLFRRSPPTPLLRRYLIGQHAPDSLVEQVRAAVNSVPPAVLARRLSNVLSVDVAANLARLVGQLVYLRGTKDRLISELSVERVLRAAARPVTLVRIPAPHLVLQTMPEAAWTAITQNVLDKR